MAEEVKKTKKKKFGKIKTVATVLVSVIIVFLIAATAAQRLGNLTLTAVSTDVKAYFMSFSAGGGYPYEINASDVKDIEINNSNLILLLNNKTTILTPTAKEIMPQEHTYSNPVMKIKGSKMIVYDLNSGKYRIQSGSEIVAEFEEKNNIMCGAIGKSGNYAIGTYSDECQSVFTAFSKSGKKEFSYKFKSERITAVSLSDNGKFAAVGVLNADNGVIFSKLYIFDFSKEKPISVFDYSSSAILDLNYVNDTNLEVICNNMRSFIKANTLRQGDIKFNSNLLNSSSSASNGCTAIVLSRFGSTAFSKLSFYTNTNKEKFSLDFNDNVKFVSTDGKYTAVLFDNTVKTFNNKGKQIGEIFFDAEPVRVQVDSGKTYVLTSVGIKCYKTRGTTDERMTENE